MIDPELLFRQIKKQIGDTDWRLVREEGGVGSRPHNWHDGAGQHLDLSRHDLHGAVVYYLWVHRGSTQKLRLCWDGGMICVQYDRMLGKDGFTLRASDEALVEARLRGLI